jgi:hypothetical protein
MTQVDDVPSSPTPGVVRRGNGNSAPSRDVEPNDGATSWCKTSFDDIAVDGDGADLTESSAYADRVPAAAGGGDNGAEAGELFAHNKLRLSFRSFVAVRAEELNSLRKHVNSGTATGLRRAASFADGVEPDRRKSSSNQKPRSQSFSTSHHRPTVATSTAVDGSFNSSPRVSKDNCSSTTFDAVLDGSAACVNRRFSNTWEQMDERLLAAIQRLAADAAASAEPRQSVPGYADGYQTSNDGSRRSSPSPPPLPTSLPPPLPATNTSASKLDLLDWSTFSSNEDEGLPSLEQSSSPTNGTDWRQLDRFPLGAVSNLVRGSASEGQAVEATYSVASLAVGSRRGFASNGDSVKFVSDMTNNQHEKMSRDERAESIESPSVLETTDKDKESKLFCDHSLETAAATEISADLQVKVTEELPSIPQEMIALSSTESSSSETESNGVVDTPLDDRLEVESGATPGAVSTDNNHKNMEPLRAPWPRNFANDRNHRQSTAKSEGSRVAEFAATAVNVSVKREGNKQVRTLTVDTLLNNDHSDSSSPEAEVGDDKTNGLKAHRTISNSLSHAVVDGNSNVTALAKSNKNNGNCYCDPVSVQAVGSTVSLFLTRQPVVNHQDAATINRRSQTAKIIVQGGMNKTSVVSQSIGMDRRPVPATLSAESRQHYGIGRHGPTVVQVGMHPHLGRRQRDVNSSSNVAIGDKPHCDGRRRRFKQLKLFSSVISVAKDSACLTSTVNVTSFLHTYSD